MTLRLVFMGTPDFAVPTLLSCSPMVTRSRRSIPAQRSPPDAA